MKVTYLGTTVLLFDDGVNQILFDANVTRPHFLKAFFGKIDSDSEIVSTIINRFHIDRLKAIFISHTHLDHVLDVASFSTLCDAEVYGSLSAVNVALGGNVSKNKCHIIKDKDRITIGDYEITILKSIHSKAHIYNNDLGKEIEEPLVLPARKGSFKEGGSYDFLIKHKGKTYLIRPSYNYIVGELNDIHADVVYLGIAGITKSSKKMREEFFKETLAKVKPTTVLPIHWDDFFRDLEDKKSVTGVWPLEKPVESIAILDEYCSQNDMNLAVQMPLTHIEF